MSNVDRNGTPPAQQASVAQPQSSGLQALAAGLARVLPATDILATSPGFDGCAEADAAVVHVVLPEPVLFATASDQPAPQAAGVLDLVAASLKHDASAAEVTVLGHTDSVGSDADNIALSRRRAETVVRALADRQVPAQQLSLVAIGERQPIASNATPEGRAQNRRVEFLISPCLAANLNIVSSVVANPAYDPASGADITSTSPVDVLRLSPTGPDSYRLQPISSIALNHLATDAATQAATRSPFETAPAGTVRQSPEPSRLLPPSGSAHASPTPAYAPKTLAPDARRNALGPAIPY